TYSDLEAMDESGALDSERQWLLEAPTNTPPPPPPTGQPEDAPREAPGDGAHDGVALDDGAIDNGALDDAAEADDASSDPPAAPEAPAEPRSERPPAKGRGLARIVGYAMLAAASAAGGYFGWQAWRSAAAPGEGPGPSPADVAPASPPAPSAAPVERSPFSLGRTYERILDAGTEVNAGEGLLMVEGGDEGPTEVLRGDVSLGTAPLSVALPEGRHALVFRREGAEKLRYVFVRAGETRVVRAE
ncbi:MAG: hypothetical protein AAF447_13205, partial [Myxococcota bacterium]